MQKKGIVWVILRIKSKLKLLNNNPKKVVDLVYKQLFHCGIIRPCVNNPIKKSMSKYLIELFILTVIVCYVQSQYFCTDTNCSVGCILLDSFCDISLATFNGTEYNSYSDYCGFVGEEFVCQYYFWLTPNCTGDSFYAGESLRGDCYVFTVTFNDTTYHSVLPKE